MSATHVSQTTEIRVILMIVAALLLVACAPMATGEIIAFNPDLGPTGTARPVPFSVDIQTAQATAAIATSTAYANATDAAIAEARMAGGRIALAMSQQAAGISERQAEKLPTEWRTRGRACTDAGQATAHVLTEAAPHG